MPTEPDVERSVAGVNSAIRASDKADTIVFEPELIDGTRYKYVLTTLFVDRE